METKISNNFQNILLGNIYELKKRADTQWENGKGERKNLKWADIKKEIAPQLSSINLCVDFACGQTKLPTRKGYCSIGFFRKDLSDEFYPKKIGQGFYIWLGYFFKTQHFELGFGYGENYDDRNDESIAISKIDENQDKYSYYYSNYDELKENFIANFLEIVGFLNSFSVKDFYLDNYLQENINIDDLASILREMYNDAEDKVSSIFLFGVKYWKVIKFNKISCRDIVVRAGLSESYKTELHKAVKLGEQLTLSTFDNSKIEKKSFSSLFSNKYSLNQILYGSPGTGKTYNTIDRALCILGYGNITNQECKLDYTNIRSKLKEINTNSKGKLLETDPNNSSDRECAKVLFDHYHNEGQIEFVTFHQNYGYEEFVEGIKPRLNDDKSNDIEYEIKDGVFKTLCNRATKPEFENQDMLQKLEKAYKDYTAKLYKHPFSLLSTKYVDERPTLTNIKELIANKEPIKQAKTLTDKANFYAMTDTSNSIRVLANTEKPSPMPLTYNEFIGSYCLDKKGTRFSYYNIFDEILKEANLDKNKVKQALSKQVSNTKPYILIIDEINRGNVSKIFGELITLIEPSKRIGADEELRVTLPYSGSQEGEEKELFGVPSNLYIIGTMNTADRSITSLDTALRRRFEFVEMMPDETKLKSIEVIHDREKKTINLQEMLKAINERIEYLYDREKTIGHANLMDIDSLDRLKGVFQNKIIPLLQEYFYNDYEAIDAILNGNGMIKIKEDEKQYLSMGAFNSYVKDRGLDEKKVFEIAPKESDIWEDVNTYKKIYEELKESKSQPNNNEANISEPSKSQ